LTIKELLSELKNIKKKDIFVFLLILLFVIFFDDLLIDHQFEFISILVVISIPFMWNAYSKINKYKKKQHDSDIKNILDAEFYDKAIKSFKNNIQLPFIFGILLLIFFISFIGNKLYINILSYSFITSYICFIFYIPQIYEVLVEEKSRKNLKEFLEKDEIEYDKFKKIYEELFDNYYDFNKKEYGINDELLYKNFFKKFKDLTVNQKIKIDDCLQLFKSINLDKRNIFVLNKVFTKQIKLIKFVENKKVYKYAEITKIILDYLSYFIDYTFTTDNLLFYKVNRDFKEFVNKNTNSDKSNNYIQSDSYKIKLIKLFFKNIFSRLFSERINKEKFIKYKNLINKFWELKLSNYKKNINIFKYIVKLYLDYLKRYLWNPSFSLFVIVESSDVMFPVSENNSLISILLINVMVKKGQEKKVKKYITKYSYFGVNKLFIEFTREETFKFINLLSYLDMFKTNHIDKVKKYLEKLLRKLKEKNKLKVKEKNLKDNLKQIIFYYKEYLDYLEENND